MSSAIKLKGSVLAARARLAEGREKLRQRHDKGSPGFQVSEGLADLWDGILVQLYEAAVADLGLAEPTLSEQIALVPHGGYGRRDIAPFSDVDLMILHSPAATGDVARLAERLVRDVFDAGLTLGQSVRTPAQACQLARRDATICTSLVEARHLAGSESLVHRFQERFLQQARRRAASLVPAMERARGQERRQFGETVYLLEPNIKRSRGGLRDIQLLRWVGFARYGTRDPDGLRMQGELSPEDYQVLRRGWEFLLRLRNEMHFHAGKSYDVLDCVEQVRLASWFGCQGEENLLPVEQFMREYFRFTNGISHVVTRFLASARPAPRWGRLWAPLLSHQFEGDYRVSRNQIAANERGLAKLRQGDLAEVLRLASVANSYDKPISHATSETIRASVPAMSEEVSPQTCEHFIELLSRPARLAELLRSLHEMGVLEKLIPAFAHARNLLQFNQYHKYTVDEHSLLAVEKATHFQTDAGPLGWAYRGLRRKWLLHLALLIHDLGKGYAEDHSEVGRRIAHETAARLQLAEQDAEALAFLVHKHLLMSHLAFRRDTSDDALVVQFAVDIGSPEVLQMLFLLTAADLDAVGPGVLNAWKTEVLADLYQRSMEHLAPDAAVPHARDRLEQARRAAAELLAAAPEHERLWYDRQLAAMPPTYLLHTTPRDVAADLQRLRAVGREECHARGEYHAATNTVEFKIGAYEGITPGIFHKLAGALASQGAQVLSAEIHTLSDGLIFDRFWVQDPDFSGPPPADRLEQICKALRDSVTIADQKSPAFRRVWRPNESLRQAALPALPTRVRVDNSVSDRYTIVDVFTLDRPGLLYTIGRTLFMAGLSVWVAKIGTYLDQVVDVFYVTDEKGAKVTDEPRLQALRAALQADIGALNAAERGEGLGTRE